MTLSVIDAVLARSKAGGTDKLILVIMARAANRRGYTRLPVRLIAILCNRSQQTVRESLDRLAETKEIYRVEAGGGKGKATVWQIAGIGFEVLMPDLRIPPEDHNWHPSEPHWRNTKIKNRQPPI